MKDFSVFVLDDDIRFCELLEVLVKHHTFTSKLLGYNIIFTIWSDMRKIDEAIDQIKKTMPDLMLLDYMLGASIDSCLDSLVVLREVIPYCSDVFLMSGLHPEDIRLELTKEALIGLGLLEKPFNTTELVHVIKSSIRKKEDAEHN